MADPVTWLAIGGAAVSGVSMIQQGRIAKAQGEAADEVNEYNAKQLERQAEAEKDAARIQADRISRREKATEATNIARAAKGGISIAESPSTIDVLADNAFQFHLDRNFTLGQGMTQYQQGMQRASLLRLEGRYAKDQGKQAYTAGFIGAGGQALTAAAALNANKTPKLAGNQNAIKQAGGLNRVANSPQVNAFMRP